MCRSPRSAQNYSSRSFPSAATLFDAEGKSAFDAETLRIVARGVLIDALSCRESMSKSGVVALADPRHGGTLDPYARFTLHEADSGVSAITATRSFQTFSLESILRLPIVERPSVGAVRVFARAGDDTEFVHLAPNLAAWSALATCPSRTGR